MKKSGRLTLALLLLGMILLAGVLLRAVLLEYVVTPIALLLLYIWRIITSVDQEVYWGALVFAALVYGAYEIFQRRKKRPAALQTAPSDNNATLENVGYWRAMILITRDEIEKPNILRREMGKMVASMLAAKFGGVSPVDTINALKQRQIPLPEPVYAFLFPDESPRPRRTFQQALQALWQAPRNWIRRWTGRDWAEYQETIEKVIAYMETSMEIENENKPVESLKH